QPRPPVGPRAARNVQRARCRRVSRGGAWHMNGRWQPGAGGTTLLLVSERAEHRASLRTALEAEGHHVLAVESARAGLGLLDAEAAAVLIVEQRLGGAFGACDPETLPVFAKLRGNAAYLLELAEEFLDLSRLEADTVPGRRETVDPVPLLRELADWFTLLVRDRPVAFEADIPPDLPA